MKPFKLLNDLWKNFARLLKACGEEFDEENVHALRVSPAGWLSAVRSSRCPCTTPAVKEATRAQKGRLRPMATYATPGQLAYVSGSAANSHAGRRSWATSATRSPA
jgi:hypothetical protein